MVESRSCSLIRHTLDGGLRQVFGHPDSLEAQIFPGIHFSQAETNWLGELSDPFVYPIVKLILRQWLVPYPRLQRVLTRQVNTSVCWDTT